MSVLGAFQFGLFDPVANFAQTCLSFPEGETEFGAVLLQAGILALGTVAPLLFAVALSGVAAEIAQIGMRISTKALVLKFERIDLFKGLRRIFGVLSAEEGGEGLGSRALFFLRISVIIAAGITLAGRQILSKVHQIVSVENDDVFRDVLLRDNWTFLLEFSGLGVVVALIDYSFRRAVRRRRLAMDVQELKREMRDSDGDPLIKHRRRQLFAQLMLNALVQGVRRSKVVVSSRR